MLEELKAEATRGGGGGAGEVQYGADSSLSDLAGFGIDVRKV